MLGADRAGGVPATLKLRVHPGAKRSAVHGRYGDAWKIELQAPPVDGKANAELIKFLSGIFALPRSAVELVAGEFCRDKTVRLHGVDAAAVQQIMESGGGNEQ